MRKQLLFAFFLLSALPAIAHAAPSPQVHSVELVLFYGRGCEFCAGMREFLGHMEARYPALHVRRYEVYFDQSNAVLFERVAAAYNVEIKGVPTVFLDGDVFVGYAPHMDSDLERMIRACATRAALRR